MLNIRSFETQFIFEDESESIKQLLNENEAINWFKENYNIINTELIVSLITNLTPFSDEGKNCLMEIFDGIANHDDKEKVQLLFDKVAENKIKPVPYNEMFKQGYTGSNNDISLYKEISTKLNKIRFKNRGIEINAKGRLQVDGNIFAKYILERRLKLIRDKMDELYAYSKDGYYIKISESILKKICRQILHEAQDNIWKKAYENEYYEALLREIQIVEEMDSFKNLINLRNGIFNIDNFKLVPHNPEYLLTSQISIVYDENAKCPEFIKFLEDIFNKDEERVKLMQEIMGYLFLKEIKVQKFFVFLGRGSNGKSVLADVIRHLVGEDNTSNVPLNSLSSRFGMQNLPGKLVNISSENEIDKLINTQNLKAITGDDAVNVEVKYKDSFNTKIFAKIIVLTNTMFDSKDLTHGFLRRIQIIPFENTYVENIEYSNGNIKKMDKNLKEKILNELPGIFNFAMEGLKRLIENNFNLTFSSVCNRALEEYERSQNPLIDFLNENVEEALNGKIKKNEIKSQFLKWAYSNDYDDITNLNDKEFWDLFKKAAIKVNLNFEEIKIKGERYIKGITFKLIENEVA